MEKRETLVAFRMSFAWGVARRHPSAEMMPTETPRWTVSRAVLARHGCNRLPRESGGVHTGASSSFHTRAAEQR